MKSYLKAPSKFVWVVVWRYSNGLLHSTDFIYKSKYYAQLKADELILIYQKEYFITECCC